MKQRILLLTLAWLVLSVDAVAQRPAHTSQKPIPPDCRTFVQEFYDWYVPVTLKDHKEAAWNIAMRTKPEVFAPDLLQLLKRDAVAQSNSNEIVGLDFDPFLNSQDPSEHFKVEKVNTVGITCLSTVRGYSSGEKQELVKAEARYTNGRWVFTNFYYGNNQMGLVNLLKKLEAERNSNYKAR